MEMHKPVRRNAERLSRAQGVAQEQLAEKSGFSQQYISGLENGQRNPSVVTLHQNATALGGGCQPTC